MADLELFGHESVLTARTKGGLEAAALVEMLKALRNHPYVVWCERQNTGAARVGNRLVRFGWKGCSDIVGTLRELPA